ncbi:MAG: hypothetical protein JWO38_8 [Gemmataceae bacterium]|nr:hypothetical protein [Gemmataceae bacterium]
MAGLKIPYPPSPSDVPEDLTEYAPSYKSQQNLLLAGLFVFLLFYMALIALCVLLGTYCFVTLGKWPVVKMAGMGVCGLSFLFLVKGFFKRHPVEKEMHIEITEEEQPVLFGFIHQLCEELGAPEPNKVFVSPEVNAAVIPRTSLINVFTEPKKDLLIGLGLVNAVNLSEFKAIMAHEFGHFCQTGLTAGYGYVVNRIIYDLVEGEDLFDRMVNWCKRQPNALSAVGYFVGGFLWVGRKLLVTAYKAFTLQRLAVSREREFNADLVAVSVAGSDAMTHGLLRVEFGYMCMMQTENDLSLAADHKLYTRDLYHHQDRAGRIVRKTKKDPQLGLPPHLDGPTAGKDVRVFDREKEELEEEIPEMYRTHPSNPDREDNAKEQFVPAVVDHRSAWILFTDAADLKERVTYKYYRMTFKIKKNTELVPAEEVQQFIDDEHAETTYDPKYQGIYDGRPLAPGELAELNQLMRDSPWNDERIEKVFEKLYEGAGGKNEDYQELKKEKATLENTSGRPSRRIKKKIDRLQDEIDRIWEWFKSLDRRVYLCHVQMAAGVNPGWRDELVERYRFGLEVQRFYMESEHHAEKAFFFTRVLFHLENPHPELVAEVMQILRQAWRALKTIVQDARDINMPAMKNFEEGERLADFILEGKMVPEPPLTYVKSAWALKLVDQLRGVRRRCGRLHWKSVGGILALQEKIAAAWQEKRAPIEAAVVVEAVEAPVAAGIHPAGPPATLPAVAAEPIEAELVDAEVMDAQLIDAEEIVDTAVLEAVVVADLIEAGPARPAAVAAPRSPTPAVVPVPEPRAGRIPTPVPEPAPVLVAPPPPEPEPAPTAVAEPEPVSVPDLAPVAEAPPTPAESPPLPASLEEAPAAPEPESVVIPSAVAELISGPTPAPASQLPDEPVAAIFALDAAGPEPAPDQLRVSVETSPSPAAEGLDDFFSLDPDAAPAPVTPQPANPPPPVVAANEIFSLDADDYSPAPAVGAAVQSPAVPALAAFVPTAPAKPADSGTIPTPRAKPASVAVPTPAAREKPVAAATVTKPAKNGRPAVKITFVRPGEKSPLGG